MPPEQLTEPLEERVVAEPDEASLPVVPLATLAASGTFAVWTALTCFVC